MAAEISMVYAMRLLGEVASELRARPEHEDLLVLMSRGQEHERSVSWASVSWDELEAQHLPIYYLLQAVFSDEELLAGAGELPEDTPARLAALAKRLGDQVTTQQLRADRVKQNELLRSAAHVLELGIQGERGATTRYLNESLDALKARMDERAREYRVNLDAAKQAVDIRHRPSRPYGE